VDAEALEARLDLAEHVRDRVALEPRELLDVRAGVAFLGRRLPLPGRLDGRPEPLHLGARVVVVVLALHPVAGEGEQPCDRVAVGAVPRRGDRDRAGRVRRDHLHLHPLARLGRAGAVVAAGGDDLAERLAEPRGREP